MASDDEVFWTYGDKRKKNRKAKASANKEDAENEEQADQKVLIQKQEVPLKVQQEVNSDRQQQTDNFAKSTRLNPFGGGVDFAQSQRFEKLEERFGNGQGVRFNQSNVLGNSQGKNMQSSHGSNGVSFSNHKKGGNGNQHDYIDSEDKQKYQENFNFTFSPSEKGSSQRIKNKSGGLGLSQTTTSNFVFESASPARSTLNNRKPFNTSAKKVNEFSPSVYDKLNSTDYKFQRKGESIWDDLYQNGRAMLSKKMRLHQEKLDEEDMECVFKPRLVANNNKYFAYENNKFLERNEQWKEQRDNKLISQRQSKISVDLRECTFQPNINSHRMKTEIPKEQELDFVQDNQISLLF